MRHVLAVVSDTHCGGTTALCPDRITLDDGGEYVASKAQRWLWGRWQQFWGSVRDVRDAVKGTKLIVVCNGDLTDGDHHKTSQILSGNPTAQAAVVNAALAAPLALRPHRLLFIRGTEAHVGPSAAFEERIALGLHKDKRPVLLEAETGNASHWHAKLDIQGVRFDFAHHGRVGQRPWTKPNVVLNLAAEIFMDHARTGRPHPHIAVRSHMHQYVDTHDAHPTRVLQTPAWQLATAYIHRIAPGALADVGGIIFVVENGALTVTPVLYRPDPPTEYRL